jgi:putative tricarboxylic transport membrane protein
MVMGDWEPVTSRESPLAAVNPMLTNAQREFNSWIMGNIIIEEDLAVTIRESRVSNHGMPDRARNPMRPLELLTLVLAAVVYRAPAGAADPAKDYPGRPIRMIVTNAPGSAVDILSRIVAVRMGSLLGQQVVVDNRPGAGSALGMDIGKHAAPDGYTLVSAPTAALAVAPLIHQKRPYEIVNDYAFISLFAVTPNILAVNPPLPIKNVHDLIDYCKASQGQVNMASAGPGSQSHLTGVLLTTMGKFQSTHIPYKGGGASVAAVVAGESQWTITPAPAVWSLVKAGRLRAIGHSLPKRTPLLGDLPAIAETIPGYDYSGWNSLIAPRGTPKPILDKLRAALLKTMSLPEVKTAIAEQATEVITSTPEELRKLVQDELRKYGDVVKAVGLKIE